MIGEEYKLIDLKKKKNPTPDPLMAYFIINAH